jgi:hypothetical protein
MEVAKISLPFQAARFKLQHMTKVILLLTLSLVLSLAAVSGMAYPGNPLPENVGLYNFSTISVSTSPGQIIARNTSRNYFLIQNNGAVSVVVKPGSNPSSATNGVVLTAGSTYAPLPAMVDAWYAESASSTATLTIIEGIK